MSLLEMFCDVDTFCMTMAKTGDMKQITQKKIMGIFMEKIGNCIENLELI